MKKVLLFASAIALMTSCAKTELGTDAAPELPKGISFETVAIADNDSNTKGEWEHDPIKDQWKMFWYAEADQIKVFFKGEVNTNALPADPDWAITNVATYKATRSTANGMFTANAAAEVLNFTGLKDKKASFRLVWPSTVTVAAAFAKDSEGKNQVVVNLPAIKTQSYTKAGDEVNNVFMVNDEKVNPLTDVLPADKGNGAVADVLTMSMTKPFPVAYFKLKNYDMNLHGKLTSIKLTAKGYTEPGAQVAAISPSNIDYGTATYNVETGEAITTNNDAASTVTLNFGPSGAGLEWEDGKAAFMAINTVDRKQFTGANAEAAEEFEVVYNFEKATVTKKLTRNKPLVAGSFYNLSTPDGLDLAAEPYLHSAIQNSLVLNSVDLTKVGLTDQEKAAVTSLTSNVDLSSAANVAELAKYTALTDVVLLKNTAIPAKMFEKQTALASIKALEVAAIAADAFNVSAPFAHVILPKFDFSDPNNETASASLLKKASLVEADITSAKNIGGDFPSIGISFTGYTSLTTITIGDAAKIRDYAFSGCTSLATVNNFEKIGAVGKEAFKGCTQLVDVYAGGDVIGESAFNGCTGIKTITAPTVKTIGKDAFNGAGNATTGMTFGDNVVVTIGEAAFSGSSITTMKFPKTTTLEKEAFKDCAKFIGEKLSTTKSLISFPELTELKESVFNGVAGTGLHFYFPKVAKITGASIFGAALESVQNIKEIKFETKFVISDNVEAFKVTNSTSDVFACKLYVPSVMQSLTDPTRVAGVVLSWKGTDATEATRLSVTFNEISAQ